MDEKSSAVRVLTVSPFESDRIVLSNLISHTVWNHQCARSVEEARTLLRSERIQVVLCETEMPDGNWQTLLDFALSLPEPPEVVVFSRCPDERLWATVLNLGAWDLLSKPIQSKEFYRTVHNAFRHWAENVNQRRKTVVSAGEGRAGSSRAPRTPFAAAAR